MKRTHLLVVLLGLLCIVISTMHIGATSQATQVLSAASNTSLSNTSISKPTRASGLYSVIGRPSLSAPFMNRVLAAYHSPAAGKGVALSVLGVKYGIDPAFALAFFLHESTMGTRGEASTTLSLGNLRCIPDAACVNTLGQQCQANQSCYAAFPTWEAGFEAWYKLIRNLYVRAWGLTTVDTIIPRYAPTADHNDEAVYIASLKRELDAWREGQAIV